MTKEKKTVDEVKEVELCAVSKEFVVKQINKLIESNQEVFQEYFYWANVLNTKVSMIGQEESNDKFAE